MLLALTHGMQYGAKKTMASALGNVSVTLIQASISIAGLGTILVASEKVFYLIKWAGAAYLVYIGLRIFFSSKLLVPEQGTEKSEKITTLRKMFLQAALVTAGNQKRLYSLQQYFRNSSIQSRAICFNPAFCWGWARSSHSVAS